MVPNHTDAAKNINSVKVRFVRCEEANGYRASRCFRCGSELDSVVWLASWSSFWWCSQSFYIFMLTLHYQPITTTITTMACRFQRCLETAGTQAANRVGTIFFNVFRIPCFLRLAEEQCVNSAPNGTCLERAWGQPGRVQLYTSQTYTVPDQYSNPDWGGRWLWMCYWSTCEPVRNYSPPIPLNILTLTYEIICSHTYWLCVCVCARIIWALIGVTWTRKRSFIAVDGIMWIANHITGERGEASRHTWIPCHINEFCLHILGAFSNIESLPN